MTETHRDSGLGTRESTSTVPIDLDAAIDAVAREMTDADPSGALRARVLEQIQRRPRRSLSTAPRWAWAAGAAAAAVLAVAAAVWMARPMPGPGIPRATVAEQRSGASSPFAARAARELAQPAAAPSGAPSTTSRTAAVTRPGRGMAAKSVQPAAADAGDDLHRVPALAEIEPLRFVTVEPDPLQVDAMEMTPFPAIEPLDIPTLDRGPSDTQSVDPKKEKRP